MKHKFTFPNHPCHAILQPMSMSIFMTLRQHIERAGRWPRPAPGLLAPGSRPPPRSSLVCSFAALNAFESRARLQSSTGSVGVGPTTALLPASALPGVGARPSDAGPSDAGPAITASRFAGVLLCCARCERQKEIMHLRAEVNTYSSRAGV